MGSTEGQVPGRVLRQIFGNYVNRLLVVLVVNPVRTPALPMKRDSRQHPTSAGTARKIARWLVVAALSYPACCGCAACASLPTGPVQVEEVTYADLPFPTSYAEDGSLQLPLTDFHDLRLVSSAQAGGAQGQAKSTAHQGFAGKAGGVGQPPSGAAGGAASAAAGSGPRVVIANAAMVQQAGSRGPVGGQVQQQQQQAGSPGLAHGGPPRPPDGAPSRRMRLAGIATPPPQVWQTGSAASPPCAPPGSCPPGGGGVGGGGTAGGVVVPAVGGWEDIAAQLRARRQALADGVEGSQGPPGTSQQPRQQQQQHAASASAGPPPLPMVRIPGFDPESCAAGSQPQGHEPGPGEPRYLPDTPAPGAAAVPGRAGGQGQTGTGEGGGGAKPAGVEVPGATKPRGGARRGAMGPLLSYLRNSGAVDG